MWQQTNAYTISRAMKIKKYVLWLVNSLLAVYLVLAVTAFNKPDESREVCTRVCIDVADGNNGGFIDNKEVCRRLKNVGLFPLHKKMADVSARSIEESLLHTPFIRTANCTKTIGGTVYISITQRTPVIRIMSDDGDDYYLDDQNSIMRGRSYTSDLIVATGNISRTMATRQIAPMGQAILQNDEWRSLIEQVNVLPDKSVEIVPRVGNHIVCLGQLPDSKSDVQRQKLIETFVGRKLTRLMKFYRYGLSQAGWNRYNYISIEFDNQIICHKDPSFERKNLEAEQKTDEGISPQAQSQQQHTEQASQPAEQATPPAELSAKPAAKSDKTAAKSNNQNKKS